MFPCSNCGLCCKNISSINELKSFNLGNGVCKYLDLNTNNCMIYDERPDICRIDLMFNVVYKHQYSRDEFYLLNAKVCNELQEIFTLDTSFRIKIGE